MSASARRYSERALLERDLQRFDFQVDGEDHSVVIRRGAFDLIGPKIAVDDEAAGRIVLPNTRRTFTERAFIIAGHEIAATLAANDDGPDPVADVFVDGVSVVDGRSLDDARADAPEAELLVGRLFGSFKPILRPDVDAGGEGCAWVVVAVAIVVGAIAMLAILVDVVLVVAGAVAVFWAANTIPGRRSVIDAIRWRLLAVETAVMVALILGAAWLLRR